MPFSVTWHRLLEELEEQPGNPTFLTPLTNKAFTVTDTQEHRVIIEFHETDGSCPLQREQFETLYERVRDAREGFELDRLPPDAEPYAAVLSLHPRFEVDETADVIRFLNEADAAGPTQGSQLRTDEPRTDATDPAERTEPDVEVYTDALLLIDALERHPVADLDEMDTAPLVDLYTVLSDVQRNADELRQAIAETLLPRLHHDRPVTASFGSVQRTTRTRRELKDEDEVLSVIEDAGIDPDRVLGVDRDKVADALEVTSLSDEDVYEVEQTEYVRKAEVDDEVKETRLQGLKDRLAAAEREEAEELRAEIDELEARIEELTSFESAQTFHSRTSGGH